MKEKRKICKQISKENLRAFIMDKREELLQNFAFCTAVIG